MSKYALLILVHCLLAEAAEQPLGINSPDEGLLKSLSCDAPRTEDIPTDSLKVTRTSYRCENMFIVKELQQKSDGSFFHENFTLYGIAQVPALEKMKAIGRKYVESSQCEKVEPVLKRPQVGGERYRCKDREITLTTQKSNGLTDYTIGTWKKHP
jgi:hypothetical protein